MGTATVAPDTEGAGGLWQAFDGGCREVAYSRPVGDLTTLIRPLYGRSDREAGVQALLEACDPDVEIWPGGLWLDDSSVCRGRAEVEEFFARLGDAFEDVSFVAERFEVRGERVAVEVSLNVRGRLSGIADSRSLGHLWRFRDGRVAEIRAFPVADDAFAALRS
jgi:ketosteroid isomerase-like protein